MSVVISKEGNENLTSKEKIAIVSSVALILSAIIILFLSFLGRNNNNLEGVAECDVSAGYGCGEYPDDFR